MKRFVYVRPGSCAEASAELTEGAVYMAGGSDLLGALKQDILPKYPKKLVSLRDIPDMRGVKLEDGALKLGAMTTLGEVCESETVKNSVPALAEAAHSVATPLVRNIGTVGGNLCQDVRCWFYRYPNEIGGRLDCARKGGQECYALKGDSRYHSIFGGMKTASPVGCSGGCPNNTDIGSYMEKLRAMRENEQRWQELYTEDAEYVFVAIGLPGRAAEGIVRELREKGEKVGLIRPISVWPYPDKAFAELAAKNPGVKGFITVETNGEGQMVDDVALCAKRHGMGAVPVYALAYVCDIPKDEAVKRDFARIKAGEVKEVY